MIATRKNVLRMRNFSDKCRRENQNTQFVFNHFFSKKLSSLRGDVEKYVTAGRP